MILSILFTILNIHAMGSAQTCSCPCPSPTPSPTPQPTPIPTPQPTATPVPSPSPTPSPFVSIPFTTTEWNDDFGMASVSGAIVALQTTSVTYAPSPNASTTPGGTSSVELSTKRYTGTKGVTDFDVRLTVNTLQQLRTSGAPNAWECFWLFTNMHIGSDGTNWKNYISFKPNGIEIGTAYSTIGQTFLYTSSSVTFPIGTPYSIEIIKTGTNLQILKNGVQVLNQNISGLYNVPGSMALYTEDAKVLVSQFDIRVIK